MPLDNILNTIKKDTEVQVEQIAEETKGKIDELRQDYVKKTEILKEKILEKVQASASHKVEQKQFLTKSGYRSEILSKKQSVLDATFSDAVNSLANLEEGKQKALLSVLVDALPETAGEIFVTKSSAAIIKGISTKHPVSSKKLEGAGGFVFISSDVEIDNRYEVLVSLVKDNVETQVAEILFS